MIVSFAFMLWVPLSVVLIDNLVDVKCSSLKKTYRTVTNNTINYYADHSTTITSTYHRYNGSWQFVSTYLQPDIWIVRWSFCLILMHDPSTATFTFWSILTLWNAYDVIKDSILRMEIIHQYNSRFHYHQRLNNRCSPILLLQSLFHSFIQGRLMLIGCATLFGQERSNISCNRC